MNTQYIDGTWTIAEGQAFTSVNPCNEKQILWEGCSASKKQVHDAFLAAQTALSSWGQQKHDLRIQYLQQFSKTIEQKQKALTELIAHETGKPLWEAQTETQAVIAKIGISIQAYQERTSSKTLEADKNLHQSIQYKPHGVFGVLGPFNFPAHLSNGHIVPALLAGNTVIYKPSEFTPATAAFITQCWHDSGLPKGVFNLIQGNKETAIHLMNEPIQGLAFTGSYRTGLAIHQHFNQKPEVILALEMGGNNPLIIDNIQDIKAAVYQIILSSFITAGQRCSCARRLFIPDTAQGKKLTQYLIEATRKIRIGAPDDKQEAFMGPVIRETQAIEHLSKQEKLLSLGGESLLKMRHLKNNTGFLSPGIMDMTEAKDSIDEEIFAPFIQIFRYQHFEDALFMANKTQYGLVAGLISDAPNRYQTFFQSIRAGVVYWNRPTTGASSQLPFGGIGHSGNHRPSAYFAADYCSYPVSSTTSSDLTLPIKQLPGLMLE